MGQEPLGLPSVIPFELRVQSSLGVTILLPQHVPAAVLSYLGAWESFFLMILHMCMFTCLLHTSNMQRPEEGIRSTGAGVTDAQSFLMEVLGTKLWSLAEQWCHLSHLRSRFAV